MTPVRRRALLVCAGSLGAVGLAHALRPTIHMADELGQPDLQQIFPKAFGTWRIDPTVPVVMPSPDTQALLDSIYNQTLTRTYVDDKGRRVMLSVAYGGDQSDATRAHRPEVCYPAQGFEITADAVASVDLSDGPLPVRRLVARATGRLEPITYWVVVGTRPALSGTQQKLAQLHYGLRGEVADGLLVRVSSLSIDIDGAWRTQASFIQQLGLALAPGVRPRVVGER